MVKDILVDNKQIYNFESKFLTIFGWVTKLTLILFLFGFIENKPQMFLEFNFVIKVCLALFLIYRFNKYRKYKIEFTDLDRKVCYSAGVYILLISFVDYFTFFTNTIRGHIIQITGPYINNVANMFA
jgi:hypothetical protein